MYLLHVSVSAFWLILTLAVNGTLNRAWNRSASLRLTQWLKMIPHMIRPYYRCCCINEPVIFSHCVHLELGHRFHALLKVCTDRDDIVPFNALNRGRIYKATLQPALLLWYLLHFFVNPLRVGFNIFFPDPTTGLFSVKIRKINDGLLGIICEGNNT